MLIKDHRGNETVEPVTRVRCGGGCYYSFAESGKTSAVMSHKCNIHRGCLTNTPEGAELQQKAGFRFTLLIHDKEITVTNNHTIQMDNIWCRLSLVQT